MSNQQSEARKARDDYNKVKDNPEVSKATKDALEATAKAKENAYKEATGGSTGWGILG